MPLNFARVAKRTVKVAAVAEAHVVFAINSSLQRSSADWAIASSINVKGRASAISRYISNRLGKKYCSLRDYFQHGVDGVYVQLWARSAPKVDSVSGVDRINESTTSHAAYEAW